MEQETRTAAAMKADAALPCGSPLEVLQAFLKLGISCFGGPIAHLGFFATNSSAAANGWAKEDNQ